VGRALFLELDCLTSHSRKNPNPHHESGTSETQVPEAIVGVMASWPAGLPQIPIMPPGEGVEYKVLCRTKSTVVDDRTLAFYPPKTHVYISETNYG